MNLASLNPFRRNGTAELPEQPATPDKLVSLVQDRYTYARQQKQYMLRTWATCLAFYLGDEYHWMRWDPQARRLVDPQRAPQHRERQQRNQIPGIIDGQVSRLTQATEKPKVLPMGEDPQEKQRVQIADRRLQHWWTGYMQQPELVANTERVLFGCSFVHDYWDKSATGYLPTQEGPRMAPVGDICVSVLSPFHIFPEPGKDFANAAWCIVAERYSLSWFGDRFGVKVSPDEKGEEDFLSSLLPVMSESQQQRASGPEGTGQATLLVYYEGRTKQYPEGRTLMVCGEQLLYPEKGGTVPLPMPHGNIPLTMVPYRYVPERMWPKGCIEEVISPQRDLNRQVSIRAELARYYAFPRTFIDTDWEVDQSLYDTAPNRIIPGRFRGANPAEYVSPPPPMPSWWENLDEKAYQDIQRTSGLQGVLQGENPVGADTATAVMALRQEANQTLSNAASAGKVAYEEIARKVYLTQDERYREDRMGSLPGKTKGVRESFIVPAGPIGIRPILVELTKGVEDTEAVRQEQLQAWFGSPVAQAPIELQVILARSAGLIWLAEALEEGAPIIQQQQAQAQAAQQGQAQQEQDAAQQQQDAQAAQQQAQLEGQQQQQAQQAGAAQQQLAITAAQKAQELHHKDAAHRQQLQHQAEAQNAAMAAQVSKAMLAEAAAKRQAKVKPKAAGKR